MVMDRLGRGQSARPNGVVGEVVAVAQCGGCRVKASLRDAGGMLRVTYEPQDTSNYCVFGLKNKPKGIYCANMKRALDAAHNEFDEFVYRSEAGAENSELAAKVSRKGLNS